jgi:hypothetical protein
MPTGVESEWMVPCGCPILGAMLEEFFLGHGMKPFTKNGVPLVSSD